MTSDDQYFLDQLNRASDSVRRFTADLWNFGEATDATIKSTLRDGVDRVNHVLGLSIPLPGIPKKSAAPIRSVSRVGSWQNAQNWMLRNRGKTAFIVSLLAAGTLSAFILYSQSRSRRKVRQAQRGQRGARNEVIVMIGTPGSPLMRSLAIDLERRGFIVYVVVGSEEELLDVQNELRTDIRPLTLRLNDPFQVDSAIEQFRAILDSRQQVLPGAAPQLKLRGIIVAPDVRCQAQSVEKISTPVWANSINKKLVGTVSTVGAFLPLAIDHKSRVVVLTPTIISSLNLPFHAVEITTVGGLEGYTRSLQRELSTSGVSVIHMKLGSIDYGNLAPRSHSRIPLKKLMNASELHHAVFDALTTTAWFRTYRLGSGATMYDFVGSWMPASLVDWVLPKSKGIYAVFDA